MNTEAYKAMKKACENFVNKVETGKARSKNSYKEMKKALQLAENNEVLDLVSGCSLEEMQSLRKVYKERAEMCARNDNYREAHEENIRLGVMDLLISKSNNR